MSLKLHHSIYGEGEPVLILHGLFGSSTNWRSVARALSDNYRIITPDLRNHGQTGHTDSMTYQEMGEDIIRLLDELSLEHATIIGHSMGGKIAMINALLFPDRIKKLFILDIAPADYEHRYGKIFHVMQNLPLDKINNRNEAEAILNEQFDDLFLVRFLLQNLNRKDGGYEWRINLTAIRNNIDLISTFPELEPGRIFDKPVRFLAGETSRFIQPDHQQIIHRYFPGAKIKYVKNAGHMLHVEQPETVLEEFRLFLQA